MSEHVSADPVSLDPLLLSLASRGVRLDGAQRERLSRFAALLLEWNERVNLTAITDPQEIATKHFLDSLTLLAARPPRPGARLVDVGTGAGFPGIPLAIARPDVRVTLVESVAKKVRFLDAVVAALELRNVEAVRARAEELAHDAARRERYDVAVARALPSLAANLELLLPFCAVGGEAVAYKGRVDAELPSAERAARALGGEIVAIVTTASLGLADPLPGRCLVVVAKRHRVAAGYPRGAAEMKRRAW
jgi:16S rRNA (guanine527-N7)-methyltransferase